jgi:primosomal protein DnaI
MKKMSATITDLGYKTDITNNLELSFNEALKSAKFKEFVSKIKLPREELIKYTSQLEESFEEYSHCAKCKSIHECKNKVCGYAYLPKIVNNKLQFNYAPCKFQKKVIEVETARKNVSFIDTPKELMEADMSNIYLDDKKRLKVIDWLNNFFENHQSNTKGLFLSGSFGTGKTYLVAALFNELSKKGIKSAIVYYPEFLRSLKGSFGTDFNARMDYVKRVPLLLLDDIGAEASTVWSRDEILGPIMQYRMQEHLPIFLTSNLSLEELEAHFSVTHDEVDTVKAKRIIERINQTSDVIKLVGKNFRK